jgi:hypothetical protein
LWKKIGRYLQRWELDAAIDVLTMCSCHLSSTNPLHLEVARKRQLLQQYGRILQADNRFTHWQEVPLCTQSMVDNVLVKEQFVCLLDFYEGE